MDREFTSGGTVYRKFQISNDKFQIKWLVTKSTPSEIYPKGYWRLPKGWLDDEKGGKEPGPLTRGEKKATDEILRKTALREVEEEGGVRAKIVKKIGTLRFFRGLNTLKFVTFYLMEWVQDIASGPGPETEKVKWLPYSSAKKMLKYPGEKEFLEKAKVILDSGVPSET